MQGAKRKYPPRPFRCGCKDKLNVASPVWLFNKHRSMESHYRRLRLSRALPLAFCVLLRATGPEIFGIH